MIPFADFTFLFVNHKYKCLLKEITYVPYPKD